ncbi:MAG: YeeE/YedE thiosulfate transporter family protein [Thermodesulfobacteriota bacterium]|nr:YeeE/YedE thiosulfate transporter family protein [Thermodesulfobacteriota bacterium]
MKNKTLNPYVAGALIGILLVLSVIVAGKYLGASTTFARGASVIEKSVGIDYSRFEYFTTKKGKYGPGSLPNWQLMYVIGIALGAFIAAKLSGTFRAKAVPTMWKNKFGSSPLKRGIVAFIGGTVVLIGARLAGGCPTGHGLSGLSQLAVSGFIALAFFVIGAAITARILYSR